MVATNLKIKRKIILFLGAIIMLIFFHYLGWLGWLEKTTRNLFIPISKTTLEWRIVMSDKYNSFKKRQDLSNLYSQCLEKNKTVDEQKSKISVLLEENDKLKKIVNWQSKTKLSIVSAKVVGKGANELEKTIIIDIDEKQQIKIGQPVIVGEGILIGKIIKIENGASIVRLINDNKSKVVATILNKDKSLGVVEGGYGLSVRMNFIPRNETILIGDQVITSGLEENIPRGLVIGEVVVAENESYQPFQQAILTPATDLSKITVVSVILSSK